MEETLLITYENYLKKFRNLVKDIGLNNSMQKEHILKILFDNKEHHLSTEQILQKSKIDYKVNISIAAIYKILNLFEELNIVKSITIEGFESKVYELNLSTHHDHLVCIKCGKIIEFFDKELEKIQEEIAKEKGFELKTHTMLLYGICESCGKNV